MKRVDDFMPELFVRRLEPRMVLNAAPVLSSVAPILLDSISEDAVAPQDGDSVGTPVGNIVGLDDDVATPDNVADADANSVTGIAIVGFDDLQGSLFYTIDGGTNWSELSSASTNSALVLAADADTSIFYQADGDINGTIDPAITFVAWDQTAHSNGDLNVDTSAVGEDSFSNASDTASIVVTPANDAPILDASIVIELDLISEDADVPQAGDNVGTAIESIVADGSDPDNISDIDSGSVTGIAIIGFNSAQGDLYYTTDGGNNWSELTSASTDSALVLAADTQTSIFYRANDNFNGTVANAITFVAWDQSAHSNGDLSVDTTASDTSFSSTSDTASLAVQAINDAPVLDASIVLELDQVSEDTNVPQAGDNVGTVIEKLVANGSAPNNVSDIDSGSETGIAIVGFDSAQGNLYYTTDGGANWSEFTSASIDSALVLAADTQTRIFYRANDNFNGTVANAITFVAWDQTTHSNGDLNVDTTVASDTSFSSASDTASLAVQAINDAPVLDASIVIELEGISEDSVAPVAGDNVGTAIEKLVADGSAPNNVSDVDAASVTGIAIVGFDNSKGSLYYTIDGGANWSKLNNASTTSALVLAADLQSSVFFHAKNNFSGTVQEAITFVAWDQTAHSAGELNVDTTVGGDTSFSNASDTASLAVQASADAPVLDPTVVVELDPIPEDADVPQAGDDVGTAIENIVSDGPAPNNVTDVDPGSETGIAIVGFDAAQGRLYYTTDGGANWSELTSASTTSALLLAADTQTSIFYRANDDFNGIVQEAITFVAWDQTAHSAGELNVDTTVEGDISFSIASDTASLTVQAVNDAPILDSSVALALDSILEDEAVPVAGDDVGTAIETLVANGSAPNNVTDIDDASQTGIAIVGFDSAQGRLYYTTDGGDNWSEITSASTTSALLLAADTQTSILYRANDDFNGTVQEAIKFVAWDQSAHTNGDLNVDTTVASDTSFSSVGDTASLDVQAVNDAPSFVGGPNQELNEDVLVEQTVEKWATSIGAGAADEDIAQQQLTFNVTTDADELFDVGPAITADGTLTYTLAADAYGLATVTVILEDDGLSGGANGDVNTSAPQQFEISILPINDAPSFNAGPDQFVNEDAGLQTVIDWATDVISGPDNESDQQLTFDVVTNAASVGLFAVAPAISSDGTLTYTTASDANGTATVTVTLSDDGPTDLGNVNVNTSGPQEFTITIAALNDAPTFTAGPNQYVHEDAGLQMVAGWATAMDAGAADESEQTLTFQVTTNAEDQHLFSQLPSIDAAGELTYTIALNKNGSATVTVTLVDDGPSGNGNVNTSVPHEFTIQITPVNDAPILNFQQAVSGNEDEHINLVFPADVDLPAIIDVDADENPGPLSLQLSVGSGILIFGTTDGLSFDVGSNNSASMTVSGLLDDLNTALSSLQYQGDLNANFVNSGIVTVSVVIDDQGNSGIVLYGEGNEGENENESLTDSGQIAVTVDPVNDAPVFSIESEKAWESNEDALIKLDRLRIEDLDFLETAGGVMSVHIWTGAGKLSHGDDSGLASVVSVAGAANIQASGSLDSLQNFLNELTYQPEADYFGELNFSITVNDLGNTGDGNVLLAQKDSFEITVLPVNDPPRFVSPADPTVVVHVDAGTPITVSIADVFAGPSNEFFASVHNDLPVQTDVKFVATPRSDAVVGDIITVLNDNDGTLKFIPNQLSGFSVVIDVVATDEGGTERGGIDTTTTSFTLTVVVDTIPTPPIQTPSPPRPTFPVLSRADNSTPTNRVADAPVSTTESSAAGSDAASTEEKSIVVRRVIERNGGETVEEEKVVVWEYSELEKLTDRLRQLPDQRYRIYLQREDGTQVRIREVYVRRGNLLDPADLEAAQAAQTKNETPRAEAPTSKDRPVDQEQAAEQELPASPDFGRIDTTEPVIEPTSALLTVSSVVLAARSGQSRGRSLSQAARRLRSSVSYREITG